MTLSDDIIKKLRRRFEPSTTTQFRYRSNDVVVQSDEEGNAIRMFIGKTNDKGMIKGDRYSRTLKKIKKETLLKITGKEKAKLPDNLVEKFSYLKHSSSLSKLLRTLSNSQNQQHDTCSYAYTSKRTH